MFVEIFHCISLTLSRVFFSLFVIFFRFINWAIACGVYFCVGINIQILYYILVLARVAPASKAHLFRNLLFFLVEKMRSDMWFRHVSVRHTKCCQLMRVELFNWKDGNLMGKNYTLNRDKKKIRTTQILKVTFDHNYLHGLRQTNT